MRYIIILLTCAAAACGDNNAVGSRTPVAPTPTTVTPPPVAPPPAPPGFTGTVTDTVSKAPIVGFTAMINGARLTVSAAGYVTRETSASASTVDLIPEREFDIEFYRQLARGTLEDPIQPLRVLRQAPSFYMEVEGSKGLSAQLARQAESVVRRMVPELTGGRFRVEVWETGPTPRPPQDGWIMIERRDREPGVCGSALVGARAGQISLDGNPQGCNLNAVVGHELGHALGFWHVGVPGSLMFPQQRNSNVNDEPTERERHHAAIAYSRQAGNRDIDIDP